MEDLHRINKEINGVKYERDETNSGTKDTYFTPKEFYANGSGDCEDFAIAKYFKLKSQGYNPDDMRVSYVNLNRGRKKNRDAEGNITDGYTNAGKKGKKSEPHMVLIVNGMVLDNTTDDVKTFDEREDLDFVYGLNEYDALVGKSHKMGLENFSKWNDLLSRIDEEDMIDDYEDGI